MASYRRAKDITVAVIGYGGAFNMGKAHLEQMEAAGMTPRAVCELDAARLEVAKQDFPGIQCYDSVAAMLKQSDAELVTLITPHNTHAPLGLQCLKAGRHVVAEKPFAITTAECDAMIKEARKRTLVLSCYHNRHWDGCALEAVDKVVKQQCVGKVVRIDVRWGGYNMPRDWWRSSKTISGGIMYDWGVHLLEYALQLLPGRKLVEVSGFAHNGYWGPQTRWKKDANEDEAHAVARFDDGSFIHLCTSALEQNGKPGLIEVTGTEGAYLLDHKNYTIIGRKSGEVVTTVGFNREGQQHKYYKNIADHLVKGTELVITPEWARRPIHIIDLAGRSAEKNKTLPAKYA